MVFYRYAIDGLSADKMRVLLMPYTEQTGPDGKQLSSRSGH